MNKLQKRYHFILLGMIWFLLIANPLYAYLDPGTGSMFLQLLMGGIAGLVVIGKMYWRKIFSFGTEKNKTSDTDPVNMESMRNLNTDE